ncbi:MAG TPA: ATP-dependent DNA helicase RecG [Clostridiaceae bacterium]|nr:ATP-dependent DNA helicase RecG [Clostridiaceae bacterium]
MQLKVSNIFEKPIRYLKGVGEERAKLFAKLGIYTVEDVITHFPRDYEDRRTIKPIAVLFDGEACSVEGTVLSKVQVSRPRKSLAIYKLQVRDNTGILTVTWFNLHYIKNAFKPGETYLFYGKVNRKFNYIEMLNPVYEKKDEEMQNMCCIVPIYPSTKNLTQNIIRKVIRTALDSIDNTIPDPLPEWIRSKYHLSEINYCIQNIHFPRSEEDFRNARYRLVFEELLLFQLGLLATKHSIDFDKPGIAFGSHIEEIDSFIRGLPFELTRAQKRVIQEVSKDMESSKVMNRLIQGDVGSGKTIVAVIALFKAIKSGYQGCLMVPTEILAEQHYNSISSLVSHYGINVGLLTGSITKKQKEELITKINSGEIDIVIGTHALLEDNVTFKCLGLVITDEQHRFGVRQRALLSRKGENPDVLVMTATPIPRTLALILYGDLDISVIDELPPDRKPVDTYVVQENMRSRINNFIRKKVNEGRQVYIVCPLIEESEAIDAKSAMDMAEQIANVDFPDLRTALIHGKTKPKEKEEIMRDFINGKTDILVSTTVIEVGVNVPNACIMVIENAERFGLAQLHQLRGRVGRGKHQSYCILYSEGKSEVSKERLAVLQETNDGFAISEKDLELRGPGDFFGTRQHGLPELKIANLYKDMDVLKSAQEAALTLLETDRLLESKENSVLKEKIMKKFNRKDLSFN